MENKALLAQVAGNDGDDALYEGNWVLAYEKYEEAKALCNEALLEGGSEVGGLTAMMKTLITRYSEKASQIQQYLNSTASLYVDDNETSRLSTMQFPNITSAAEVSYRLQESDIPFQSLRDQSFSESEGLVGGTSGGWNVNEMLWNGVERLLELLPSRAQLQTWRMGSPRGGTGSLDESFVFINGSSSTSGETTSVSGGGLFDGVSTSTDTLNVHQLQAEVSRLRAENIQLRTMNVGKPGMNTLMKENINLKQSILLFRDGFEKHKSKIAQSVIGINSPLASHEVLPPPTNISASTPPPPTGSPSNGNADLKRIANLESTVHNLYEILQQQEQLIKELESYKTKYEKIRDNARAKKQHRFSLSTGTSPDSETRPG
eukprot:TRINITY_DN12613_c0_g1_i1.p1 TRINITY_DN12613_c0_g1~~TRINITY_DN12613_c0_g1_i1.p1  ORF type:complete len:375 (+),score=60.38 TRINITY_DN12613_c0_g1_i1:117-1241(+)